MKKDRIVYDFVKKPISQKVGTGRTILVQMKNNPKFTNPDVTIEELETVTNLLETRSVTAQGGSKEAIVLMHQTEDEWDDLMRKMANYVDRVADGDGAVILNAGFNLAKQPVPSVRPDFSVELGEKSGSAFLRRQAVDGAKSYIWQYCIGDMPAFKDSDWTTVEVTSKASVELIGLIPLSKYWFRSAAVTTTGTTAYNVPIMQVII